MDAVHYLARCDTWEQFNALFPEQEEHVILTRLAVLVAIRDACHEIAEDAPLQVYDEIEHRKKQIAEKWSDDPLPRPSQKDPVPPHPGAPNKGARAGGQGEGAGEKDVRHPVPRINLN